MTAETFSICCRRVSVYSGCSYLNCIAHDLIDWSRGTLSKEETVKGTMTDVAVSLFIDR